MERQISAAAEQQNTNLTISNIRRQWRVHRTVTQPSFWAQAKGRLPLFRFPYSSRCLCPPPPAKAPYNTHHLKQHLLDQVFWITIEMEYPMFLQGHCRTVNLHGNSPSDRLNKRLQTLHYLKVSSVTSLPKVLMDVYMQHGGARGWTGISNHQNSNEGTTKVGNR